MNEVSWSPCLHEGYSLIASCFLLFWPLRFPLSLASLAFTESWASWPSIYLKISYQSSWSHKLSKSRFQLPPWSSFIPVLSFCFSFSHIHFPDYQPCSTLLLKHTIFNTTSVAFLSWYELRSSLFYPSKTFINILRVSFSPWSSPWSLPMWVNTTYFVTQVPP